MINCQYTISQVKYQGTIDTIIFVTHYSIQTVLFLYLKNLFSYSNILRLNLRLPLTIHCSHIPFYLRFLSPLSSTFSQLYSRSVPLSNWRLSDRQTKYGLKVRTRSSEPSGTSFHAQILVRGRRCFFLRPIFCYNAYSPLFIIRQAIIKIIKVL